MVDVFEGSALRDTRGEHRVEAWAGNGAGMLSQQWLWPTLQVALELGWPFRVTLGVQGGIGPGTHPDQTLGIGCPGKECGLP